jgi:hypothetical protein
MIETSEDVLLWSRTHTVCSTDSVGFHRTESNLDKKGEIEKEKKKKKTFFSMVTIFDWAYTTIQPARNRGSLLKGQRGSSQGSSRGSSSFVDTVIYLFLSSKLRHLLFFAKHDLIHIETFMNRCETVYIKGYFYTTQFIRCTLVT